VNGHEAELSTLACIAIGLGIVLAMDCIAWVLAWMDRRSERNHYGREKR